MQQTEHKQDFQGKNLLAGVPDGYDGYVLVNMAHQAFAEGHRALHIATDDMRLAHLEELIRFYDPAVQIVRFPAWDCLPYDRISPHGDILGQRVAALMELLHPPGGPCVVLTTVNAVVQRVPSRDNFKKAGFQASVGDSLRLQSLQEYLGGNGYTRTDTVREGGEYAIRGSLIDIFPPASENPVRIDLFGEEIESIRSFDPLTQRTLDKLENFILRPVSELTLDPEAIARFRQNYRQMFGAMKGDDPLYEAVSAGRRHAGVEHWLPLFFEKLETVFDYAGCAAVTLDPQFDIARDARLTQIADFYAARLSMQDIEKKAGGVVYHPVPVENLFIGDEEWAARLSGLNVTEFSPFKAPSPQPSPPDGGRGLGEGGESGAVKGRDFSDVRAQGQVNIYEAVRGHIEAVQKTGKRVLIAAYSVGARERLRGVLSEHGVKRLEFVADWHSLQGFKTETVAMAVLSLEHGYESEDLAVLTEQDILGDRLARPARRKRRGENFIPDISALNEGDYVVHQDHGIGLFEGLETVVAANVPHDCLRIVYAGGDKLFVPVENLEVLSRFGSGDAGATLDKLGGAGWQARKARVKKDLLEMADALLAIAAARILKKADIIEAPEGLYAEFCARFPYPETEDQDKAIGDVLADLTAGQPMDRLVCGDVGFGKTEVALRAAFVGAMSGHQVAVIAPTALLCRQHYQTFLKRFHGLPVRIVQLSRLVSAADAKRNKDEIAAGKAHIVIGTHALLGEGVKFQNLGLMIVDEEQRFGVKQKERLKHLSDNVHVLTLTATPIPRTLQMALAGVRELSLIATPPVDRLAVRTFILPFDPLVVREALMREHYRGGQSFYVCPRVSDIGKVDEMLKELVPELKTVTAHGQMTPEELESRMEAFYDGKYDILLATNIIESGLDIPNANTMVMHRSDLFGLAQLYQLRGRIGRSKARGYAYLTYEADKKLTKNAEQRLHVMETLTTLGAGFQLASHDLDIRGAGNLLGEEQSGHIREVGVELYQQMLEEAVAAARSGVGIAQIVEDWTPQIQLGTPVLIPENYIADLHVRLAVYRRISELVDKAEIESYAAELIDRFGELPREVENLLDTIAIKQLCRKANVARVEAGPKGVVIHFRNDKFENVAALLGYVTKQAGTAKVRPDQKLVFIRAWPEDSQRIKGVQRILDDLAGLAAGG